MNAHMRSFTVERATLTDDGLGTATTWATDGTVSLALLPASRSLLERANLLGVRATHTALLPKGFTISPSDTRLKDGSTVYQVRDVTPHPRGTVAMLEVAP